MYRDPARPTIQKTCTFRELVYQTVRVPGCARRADSLHTYPAATSCHCGKCDRGSTDCTVRGLGPSYCSFGDVREQGQRALWAAHPRRAKRPRCLRAHVPRVQATRDPTQPCSPERRSPRTGKAGARSHSTKVWTLLVSFNLNFGSISCFPFLIDLEVFKINLVILQITKSRLWRRRSQDDGVGELGGT